MNSIDKDVYAAPQIHPDELKALAHQGIKSVICNRPDNEEAGQPDAEAIAQAAHENGIRFAYIPQVGGGPVLPETIEAMRIAVNEMPRPMLLYCRSGARSTKLYELAD